MLASERGRWAVSILTYARSDLKQQPLDTKTVGHFEADVGDETNRSLLEYSDVSNV